MWPPREVAADAALINTLTAVTAHAPAACLSPGMRPHARTARGGTAAGLSWKDSLDARRVEWQCSARYGFGAAIIRIAKASARKAARCIRRSCNATAYEPLAAGGNLSRGVQMHAKQRTLAS